MHQWAFLCVCVILEEVVFIRVKSIHMWGKMALSALYNDLS